MIEFSLADRPLVGFGPPGWKRVRTGRVGWTFVGQSDGGGSGGIGSEMLVVGVSVHTLVHRPANRLAARTGRVASAGNVVGD